MSNTDESRAAARAALETYVGTPGFEVDDETGIVDLIADLMHLADSLTDVDTSGDFVADTASGHYHEDIDGEV